MSYICKNCGRYILDEEYIKNLNKRGDALGCGCAIWLIILLCFVSLILLPIAIILIWKEFNKTPKDICPYCEAENSLLPLTSPVAQKILKEYYNEQDIKEMCTKDEKYKQEQAVLKKQKEEENKKNNQMGLGVGLFVIILYILSLIFK